MIYEGEGEVLPTATTEKVLEAAKLMANGMGGYDWSALELAVEKFDVDNVEALIDGLIVVRTWKKPGDEPPP